VAKPEHALPASWVWTLWLPFACGYFVSFWLRNVNAVLAPELTRDFSLSGAELGLLTSTYSLTFALAQLPGGMLLDRFGARRVNASLMLVAVAGCALMASAQGFAGVALGRALAGLGVSMCLMAAVNAFSHWLPVQRLPFALSMLLMVGGLGGLLATAPVGWALGFTGWRTLFAVAALAMAGAVVFLFVAAPERPLAGRPESAAQLAAGFRGVFLHWPFWRLNLPVMVSAGTFQAFLSVWIGPWMLDAGGLAREEAIAMVAWAALATTAGFALFGFVANALVARGWEPLRVFKWHMGCVVAAFALITAAGPNAAPAWVAYFVVGTGGAVVSTLVTRMFPQHLNGRASSAANMLTFFSTFGLQWGIGAALDLYPAAGGGHAAAGYQRVCEALLAAHVLLYAVLVLPLRELRPLGPANPGK
jgi:predicted MFS family arabinose efflux permease